MSTCISGSSGNFKNASEADSSELSVSESLELELFGSLKKFR
jgi:hypothetical protein